ncbi:hypothetical protein B0T17DRAFT_496331 [Bombardia bombarda]|uniref:Rhodopsin domain-containing protein n=1 Tax=Bombardia bombarda TaxID=252184 RepID=A0AA40BY23_9PEZI|nr:hypothetical protein B0T17DRAFT_496331 [Bombardia bombarda]
MEEAAQAFIREVWGLQGAAYVVVGLRYFSRIHLLGWRKLALDDLLMFLSVLVYTAESTMAYLVVAYWKGFANNAMTDEQRTALDPNSEEYALRVNGSKTHVAGLLLYMTLLWLLKGCWAVYYSRLTDGVHKMRGMIHGAYIIIPLTYIACLLVALLKCIPFDHQWQISPSPGNNCMPAISTLQTVFVMVMNTVTDFYLMAIPLPMVWKSNLPPRKKIVLLIMFSGGLLEMTFGILRATSILTLGDIDPAQSGYWSVRESFVSVVLTNMPMVYPLLKKALDKSISSFSGGTNTPGGGGINGSSHVGESSHHGYRLGSHPSRKGKAGNSKHPLSIPDDTRWGSEENIVDSNTDAKTTTTEVSMSDEGGMGTTGGGGGPNGAPLPLQGFKSDVIHSERHVTANPSPSPTQAGRYQQFGSRRVRDRDGERMEDGGGIVVTHEYAVTEQDAARLKKRSERG